MKPKYESVILSVLIALSLIVSLVSAEDPGPVKFEVVENFPDVMYAGSSYEAVYSVVNVANKPILAGVNLTVIGPELLGGEFKANMSFNGFEAELVEVSGEPGVFHYEPFTIDAKFSGNLIVGVSSVLNILPANYTLETNLYIKVGRIEKVEAGKPTFINATGEAGVTLNFTSATDATVAVVDLAGNPYPTVRLPIGTRLLGKYFDLSTNATEFTVFIKLYYTDEEIASARINERTLRLYYYDGSAWRRCEHTGVNTVENYIWANVTHFTPFASFGAVRAAPPTPAKFEVTNLSVKPESVFVGEEVEVSFEVSNVGGRTGTHTLTLLVNGTVEATVDVRLRAGESRTVSFKLVKAEAGTYVVEVEGLTGSFKVEEITPPPPKPAEFEVKSLSISPSTIYPGETVTVRAEVENVGEEAGEYTVRLIINGTIEATENVSLTSGESTTVTFTVVKEVEGVYMVEVDGLEGSFTVLPTPLPKPAEFELSNLSITPAEAEPGKNVTISVIVTNVGDLEGSYTVALTINGTVESTETVTLTGGESTAVTFAVVKDEGYYLVEVDGLEGSFTITVVAPPPVPPAIPIGYVAGAIIAIIAAVSAAAVLIRRRLRRES